MKDKFLPILLAGFLLASCSSVYRSGQTPDDVYYSPTREVVRVEEKEEEKIEDRTASSEDQYLKMKVRNRYRWTSIDDYDYWNDTRYNHCNCHCNSTNFGYYNPYYNPIRYTSWSNPYYPVFVFGGTKNIKTSTSGSNVKAYGNTRFSNTNTASTPKSGSSSTSGSGSLLKKVFTSSGSTVERSQRTFGSGSSGSSSSGSSSAGGKSGGMNTSGSGSSSGRSRGN